MLKFDIKSLEIFATPYGSGAYGCQTYNQSGDCISPAPGSNNPANPQPGQTTQPSDQSGLVAGLADSGLSIIIPIGLALIVIAAGIALALRGRKSKGKSKDK